MNISRVYRLFEKAGIRYPDPGYIKTVSLLYPERRPLEVIEENDGRDLKLVLAVALTGLSLGILCLIMKGPGKEFIMLQMLAAGGICIIPIRRRQGLRELTEQRRRELELSFCELTARLSVLLGAGLSVRNCWERIVMDYRRDKASGITERKWLYEEMDLSLRLMKQGVSESEAYVKFGERMGLPPYLRLVSLLERGRRNGSRDVLETLSLEAREAFELRLRRAREQGERLGSKMLAPMMILFALVLGIIIVPVFMSW